MTEISQGQKQLEYTADLIQQFNTSKLGLEYYQKRVQSLGFKNQELEKEIDGLMKYIRKLEYVNQCLLMDVPPLK
jgi:hypothetical protein